MQADFYIRPCMEVLKRHSCFASLHPSVFLDLSGLNEGPNADRARALSLNKVWNFGSTQSKVQQIEDVAVDDDNELLLIAHNPFNETIRSSQETWCSWLHVAPIGFGSYLQRIADQIVTWTQKEEAAYQAMQLSISLKPQPEEVNKNCS
ncbi:unnamed protein product [Protopolystoma xenopodis]|uniref:Uncharacterized protein n=1 Tax=Protopolystoma xenopodis TaxID=117903 RepID=A0A448XRN4_9PLAT|nr:unnamed protein product [Protopolystoma xenopodis]